MVGVSTQSQGRGHGEGGGVQYQTLNSELEELFRQEASWGQFFLQDADFHVDISGTCTKGTILFFAEK